MIVRLTTIMRSCRLGGRMRYRSFAACAPAAWMFAALPSAAAEAGRTASLSWVELPGAEQCGGAPTIARAVEDRLGRHALLSPALADLSIEGHVERIADPPRWYALVVLRDSKGAVLGTRALMSEAEDCAPLRDSVALAVALMIDPDSILRKIPPGPAAVPPALITRETPQAPSAVAPAPMNRYAVAAHAAVGLGVLPSPSAGVEVDLRASIPHVWPVELFGGAYVPQSQSVQNRAVTRYVMAYGGLDLCPVHLGHARQAALHLCAGGQFGVVQSRSDGFDVNRPQEVTTVDAIAGGTFEWPLGDSFGLVGGGRLGLTLLGGQFVYEDSNGVERQIFERPLITATVYAGLMVLLP